MRQGAARRGIWQNRFPVDLPEKRGGASTHRQHQGQDQDPSTAQPASQPSLRFFRPRPDTSKVQTSIHLALPAGTSHRQPAAFARGPWTGFWETSPALAPRRPSLRIGIDERRASNTGSGFLFRWVWPRGCLVYRIQWLKCRALCPFRCRGRR